MKLLGLLLRHFLLCLHFWWVEIQIRFHLWIIRASGLLLLAFCLSPFAFLTSCASRQLPPATSAPSPAGVLRAVTSAKASAAALKSQVTTPEGLRDLAALNASLDTSLLEVASYSSKVEAVSLALTKAEESATYWHEKQLKALKELWMWRGLAGIALSCLAAWLAWRIYKPRFL